MKTATPIVWIAVSAGLAAWVIGRLGRPAPAPPPTRARRNPEPWFI